MQVPELAPRAETSHSVLPGASVQGVRSAGEQLHPVFSSTWVNIRTRQGIMGNKLRLEK